jgi:hypothetical protein|tara:strand:+ start:21834 stop:22172 length:339 start_codon:yes stop_codon:yes gene_type:complete
MISEFVLIISMSMNNGGHLPSQNSYNEVVIPMKNVFACELERKQIPNEAWSINGYHLSIETDCLPREDFIEPDQEYYFECFDKPQYALPEHCKDLNFDSDFPNDMVDPKEKG